MKDEYTPFDCLVCNRQLKLVKALIPYLDSNLKQSVAVFVKIKELAHTFKLSSKDYNECSKKSPENVIDAVRFYCDESEKERIDNIYNIINLFRMFSDSGIDLSSMFTGSDMDLSSMFSGSDMNFSSMFSDLDMSSILNEMLNKNNQ